MKLLLKFTAIFSTLGFVACAPKSITASTPHSFKVEVSAKVSKASPSFQIKQKHAAIVVTRTGDLSGWAQDKFDLAKAPRDADGGSAAPISSDGYFLTASHVVRHARGKYIHIVYSGNGVVKIQQARVVWNSPESDLALLHAPISTPHYYNWSHAAASFSSGQAIYHGGMRWQERVGSNAQRKGSLIYGWVDKAKNAASGRLRSSITAGQRFKMDIPLMPGDSGGPVVDSSGKLIGINSAVNLQGSGSNTRFLHSIGVRPNTGQIDRIIRADRS